MLKASLSLILLFAVWCLLSGHYTFLLLLLGGASCLISYGFYARIVHVSGENNRARDTPFNLSPLKLAGFTLWLLIEIVVAASTVLVAIINPKRPNSAIAPQFFWVDSGDLNAMGKVIYANSITLTPGTVATYIDDHSILVHALLESSRRDLEDNHMRDKVAALS